MSKKEVNLIDLRKSTAHAVTGSWNPSDFRFHQASLAAVDNLFRTATSVNEFRKLDPVAVRTYEGYCGTNTVYIKDADIEKTLDAPKKNPRNMNPGARDVASLDGNCDVLVVTGQLKFVPAYFKAANSDSPAYQLYQEQFVANYLANRGLKELLVKYITNLVNGRILWRNQHGFNKRTFITLRTQDGTAVYKLTPDDLPGIYSLATAAATYAENPREMFQLEVAATVELGIDSEVFPSQPFADPAAKTKLRPNAQSYGRVLAGRQLDAELLQAIFHSQKVGNALRTIDDSYAGEAADPIPVEIYGAVPTLRIVNRVGNGLKNSYYDLVQKDMTTLTEAEQDYVMAVFIKGGLLAFGKDE